VREGWGHTVGFGSGFLSETVTSEFLVLMEVSDRLPSSPMNLLANADAERRLLPERRRVLRIGPSKIFWLNSGCCVQRSFVALRTANPRGRNLTRNMPTSLKSA